MPPSPAARRASLPARNGIAAYYGPEILALDPATLDRFIAETPGLGIYAHYFAKLAQMRGHVRSPEVEALLAQAQDTMDTFRTIHGALENADMDFGEIADETGAARAPRAGQSAAVSRAAMIATCAAPRGSSPPMPICACNTPSRAR